MATSWKKPLLLFSALAIVGAGIAWQRWPLEREPPPPPKAEPAPAPTTIDDPLRPDRAAELSSRAPIGENWVKSAPQKEFQYSKKSGERGVEPCAAPSPEAAKRTLPLSRGYLFLGNDDPASAGDQFDLVFHLNGEGPVRRELVESKQPFVLYTLTLPPTESYAPLFAGSRLLAHLIDEISAQVSRSRQKPARLRHLALSAWSAGFEGVRSILYQPEADRVDAVLLIDGLHGPRGGKGLGTQLASFVDFAKRAERGERWFSVTHSSIPTSEFTSTTESAHFLENELGGKPTRVARDDGFGLELVEMFDKGNLHVRGYAGNDKADHCAQLLLMRELFVALHRYFERR
ncbi:MAG TPA: hypothetical protein VFQ35_05450 [Polyangiaceae bacterium]|nr:hypothetical protein [Polyangiaceae bacterium]